jgi:hypothetical protein
MAVDEINDGVWAENTAAEEPKTQTAQNTPETQNAQKAPKTQNA